MNENCWCSSCVHTALFHLDVVKLVPGDQYIATLDLIERFKFFTEIPKCASVWTELFSASIPLPCTLLCHHFVMKAVLTLLFVLFPHVSGDFLHFPMGWCHGSSPDEKQGKASASQQGDPLGKCHLLQKGGTARRNDLWRTQGDLLGDFVSWPKAEFWAPERTGQSF